MSRKLLIAVLALAVVVELALALGGFFVPATLLEAFKVSVTPETLFLADVIAWLLLIITLAAALAACWVVRNDPAGWTLSFALGIWWIGIGVGLFARHGIVDNLFMDSLKGLLIVVFAWRSCPRCRTP